MGELFRITKQGKWDYKVGGFTKWDNFYYKKEKLLLQSGAGIAKWNICYKSGRSNNHSHYNNFAKVTYDFNVEPSCFTAWKVNKGSGFSCQHFPAFGLNAERYLSISLQIQSECGKIRTRKTPHLDTFHTVLVAADMISIETMTFINN